MVLVMYHLREAAAPPSQPAQVNLAFAAAAASRGSWASQVTSHEQPDDPGTWGAPGEPLFDAVDEVDVVWHQSQVKKAALRALQAAAGASGPAHVPEASLSLASPFVASHPQSRPVGAGSRNSLLNRLMSGIEEHLPFASSLPPGIAPGNVADMIMSRRTCGVFNAPERSASCSHFALTGASAGPSADDEGQDEDDSSGSYVDSGYGNSGGVGGSRSGSYSNYAPRRASGTDRHLTSVPEQGLSSALHVALGGLFPTRELAEGGSSGVPSSVRDGDDDAAVDADNDDGVEGGEGGRAGCLVLPALRSLLEMPRPGRGGGGLAAASALLGHSSATSVSSPPCTPSHHAIMRPSTSFALLRAGGQARQVPVASPVRRSGVGTGGGVDAGRMPRRSLGLRPSQLAVPGHDVQYDDDNDDDEANGGRAPLARTKSHCGGSLAAALASPCGLRAPNAHSPMRGLRSSTGLEFVGRSSGSPRGPSSPVPSSSAAAFGGAAAVAAFAPSPPPGSPAATSGSTVRPSPKGRFSWGASKLAGGKWPWSGGISSSSSCDAAAAAAAALLNPEMLSPPDGRDGSASPSAGAPWPCMSEQGATRRQTLTEPPPPPSPATSAHISKGLAAAVAGPSAAWVPPPPPTRGGSGITTAVAAAALIHPVGLGMVMGSGLKRPIR